MVEKNVCFMKIFIHKMLWETDILNTSLDYEKNTDLVTQRFQAGILSIMNAVLERDLERKQARK